VELAVYLRRGRRHVAAPGHRRRIRPDETDQAQAAKAAELFGLSKSEQALLNEVPYRGKPMPPTDPLIYRFYER
jgi:cyanate lyase